MKENEVKKLCLQLMASNDEEAVINILKEKGYWDNPDLWRYYDDAETNYNMIGNQQRFAEAALVEKIVNSIDARLINSCIEEGIDPESVNAPKSIKEAVARYFGNNPDKQYTGLIAEWSDKKRTDIARGITLAVTGYNPREGNPCITISDIGEGQTPRNMVNTFLSLTKSNKLRTNFVQGRFNMGGTGALKFCGRRNLQLILTRRNPKIIISKDEIDNEKWGFTIVRRERASGGRRNSVYTYLAPIDADKNPKHGEVLMFSSESMPLFPLDNNNPYEKKSNFGTLIKLYNYKLSGKSHIFLTGGLLGKLDVLLPSPALPIRLFECRDYKGHTGSFETNLTGIQVRLEDNKAENLEFNEPITFTMTVQNEKITGKIYAFKTNKAKEFKKSDGVLFTVNGQTQGTLSSDFYRRKTVGYSYLADSLLVILDCSNMSPDGVEDLFMASRDRLSGDEFRFEIEKNLEEELKHNQLLKDLRERRRRELIENKIGDEKPLEEVLKTLIGKYQILTSFFREGGRISNPFKTKAVISKDENFVGKRYPTFFKHRKKESEYILEKDCHINMRCRIYFETDAVNDYFDRSIDSGYNELFFLQENEQISVSNYRVNLQNGIATLNLSLPEDCKINDRIEYNFIVNDSTRIKPFKNKFCLRINPESQIKGGKGSRRKPPGEEEGDDRESLKGITFPRIEEVFEDRWESYSFDEYSGMKVIFAGNTDSNETNSPEEYDFFVNMDNIYLKHELKRLKTEPEIIKARFKFGMVLIALGLIQQDQLDSSKDKNNSQNINESEQNNIEYAVERTGKAIAPVLLPLIESLGSVELEEHLTVDYSAEVN